MRVARAARGAEGDARPGARDRLRGVLSRGGPGGGIRLGGVFEGGAGDGPDDQTSAVFASEAGGSAAEAACASWKKRESIHSVNGAAT